MKTMIQLLTGLAATTLLLSSCGDPKTSETGLPSDAPEATAYPLEVCVVSGEKLGSMGKPHVINHMGTEVRFCCGDCVHEFNKDPDKYLAKLKVGQAGEQ